jgi:hypothetical protein
LEIRTDLANLHLLVAFNMAGHRVEQKHDDSLEEMDCYWNMAKFVLKKPE